MTHVTYFQSQGELCEPSESSFLVDELLSVQVSKYEPIEPNTEVGTEETVAQRRQRGRERAYRYLSLSQQSQ